MRERTKFDRVEQIHREIRRLYRRFTNKQITAHDLKSRVNTLAVLRPGLAEKVEEPGTFTPLVVNILAVPSGYSLSQQQVEAARLGCSLIDTEQLQPLQLDDQTNSKQTDVVDPVEPPVEVELSRKELSDLHFG